MTKTWYPVVVFTLTETVSYVSTWWHSDIMATLHSLLWFLYRCTGPGLQGCQNKTWVVEVTLLIDSKVYTDFPYAWQSSAISACLLYLWRSSVFCLPLKTSYPLSFSAGLSMIAAGVVGGLLAVLIAGLSVFVLLRRRHIKRKRTMRRFLQEREVRWVTTLA